MNRISRCFFLNLLFVIFLATQFIPYAAIAGGNWRQVPADETRIVLKGWPEQNQFKYVKGWHTDNWSQECEQSYNIRGIYKTTINVCKLFPGYYYNAQTKSDDISDKGFWNWKTWKGSEITPGQDTKIEFEDPRVFRHLYFTQYGNKCQYMSHVNAAGGGPGSGQGFMPMITVMTCNADGAFKESNFRINDANEKVVISYPGEQRAATTSKGSTKALNTKTKVVSNTAIRSVPFAAHWESKSGILLGVLNYPKRGTSGSLSASSGDISCQGTWQRAGQGAKNGTWSIACSDGRTASGFYKVKEAGKGAGTGTDPDGNKVEITWGG